MSSPPSHPPRRRVGRAALLCALVCPPLVAGLALAAAWWQFEQPLRAAGAAPWRVTVHPGQGRDAVLASLDAQGLLRWPSLARFEVRRRGLGGCLKAGDHEIAAPVSLATLFVDLCAAPAAPGLRLTIPEGMNLFELEERLIETGLLPRETVPGEGPLFAAGADPAHPLVAALPSADHLQPALWPNRLEGYLFPDTYQLPAEDPVHGLIERALERRATLFAALSAGAESDLSVHALTALASLIQREARVIEEMPRIAAVYHNRLARGMKLQADPTLTYTPRAWRQVASPRLRRDRSNPFNTYAHGGLPPGPICAPGREALAAALRPAATEELFFVARPDGSGRHAFSKTFAEHRRHVARLREARRPRSAP